MEQSRTPDEAFLERLVQECAIDRASAESMRCRLRDTWVPLGQILRQKGWLTMNQLAEALERQSREPGLALGEIVLETGACTPAQLAAALKVQRELSPHVLDLMAEARNVDSVALLRAVARYVRDLENRLSEVRSDSV